MGFSRRVGRLLCVGVLAAVLAVVVGPSASAAFTNPSLVLSNNQSASLSNYTLTFTPSIPVASLIASGLSTGVALANGGAGSTVAGLGAATITTSVNTGSGWTAVAAGASGLTTTVDSTKNLVGANLAAAVFTGMTAIPQVQLKIAGLTNPTVASSTAQNVCVVDTLSVLAGLLTGVTNTGANPGPTSSTLAGVAGLVDNTCIGSTILTQLTNGVTTQLLVAPVLSMSLDSSNVSFNLTPTASGVVASGATNAITIATNAGTYTVQALVAGTSPVLTWAGSGTAASIPLSFNSATGSAPAACPANGVGTGTLGSGGSYQNVVSSVTGLTNGTVTNIGYCWKVDLTKPVGSYATTITYLAVPAF